MNDIKPVAIPREAADRIEGLRSRALNNERIVDVYVSEGRGTPPSTRGIRAIPFDTLLFALVNGYECEKTPEEKVACLYNSLCDSERIAHGLYNGDPYSYAFAARTVVRVLNALDIKIEGVNA